MLKVYARNVHLSLYQKLLFTPIKLVTMRTAASGAQNIVHAVVEQDYNLVNGGYYKEHQLAQDNSEFDNMEELGRKLWELSEQAVNSISTK